MSRRSRPPRGLSIAGAVTALLVLAGCVPVQPLPAAAEHVDATVAPTAGRAIREGGTLTMALSAEPDKLDPTTSTSLYTRYVMNGICEKLYDLDADGAVVPQLAAGMPTVSADGLTVGIPLRTGIRFADGAAFDAEAVRTTLRRDLDLPTSVRKSELGRVADIAVDSPTHLTIRYAKPFAPLLAALADRAGMIMSPKALAARGDAFGDHPVCVGPFKFVNRVPQTSITVERDPLYYDAASVHLDRVVYRIMTDSNIRSANLRSGDAQVADTISPQDVDALRLDPDVGILQTGSLGYQGLTINIGNTAGIGKPAGQHRSVLAEKPEVRRALALSIDRRALVNSVFNNWYEPACSPIAPSTPYATEASDACSPYDPAAAKKLLASAGVATPVRVKLLVSNAPDSVRFAQALQASVAAGGFDLAIEPVEYSTLLSMQNQGDFDLVQLGWSGRIDPHGNMSTFLASGGGNNASGYSDPAMDALLAKASATTDLAQRSALYGEAVTKAAEDNPIIYLYRMRNLVGYRSDVGGVATYADGVVRLGHAAFLKPEGTK